MRADGVRAYCVGVTVRGNDFKDKSHQRKLVEATDITEDIFNLCKQLFNELWDRKTPLRLLGVSLTNVTNEEEQQISLFDDGKKEKKRMLDKTVDDIRNRFGANTITRGANCDGAYNIGKKHKAQMENKKNQK
jgi:DNA polymerase-4